MQSYLKMPTVVLSGHNNDRVTGTYLVIISNNKGLLPAAELIVMMMVNYLLCATLPALLVIIAGVPLIPGEGGVVSSPDTVSQSKPSSSAPPPTEADMTYFNDDYDYEEDVIDEGTHKHQCHQT